MKPLTLWIIRAALTVQFLGVLSVPALIAAADVSAEAQRAKEESPRAMWMAEWIRPQATERTIGVLRIRDARLSFVEQVGQVDWELDLASVKRVATTNGGRAIVVTSGSGDEYVVAIMETNLTPASPKKALAIIDHARELTNANAR